MARFERLLPRPIERVWIYLTDTAYGVDLTNLAR